jgi:MSHA biogenesis protein MshL
VTVPEVLEMTRELYGYDYRKAVGGLSGAAGDAADPNVLRQLCGYGSHRLVRTRVTSGQSASNGAMGKTASPNGSNAAVADPAGGQTQSGVVRQAATAPAAGHKPARSSTRAIKVNFWQALEQSLQELLPKDASHTVVVNAESGVIAVRAMPNELNDVGKFLAKIQSTAGRQVILEAKIIEVDLEP